MELKALGHEAYSCDIELGRPREIIVRIEEAEDGE